MIVRCVTKDLEPIISFFELLDIEPPFNKEHFKECVWSDFALDYSKGVYPYDMETDTKYKAEDVDFLPKEVRSRLVVKTLISKTGCWVIK